MLWFIRTIRGPLTDHVDGGPSRPRPGMLLDGVVESGLTQLNGSHTDPEAQAEQPGHDRTHLLRTSRGGVKKKNQKKPHHVPQPMTSTHLRSREQDRINKSISRLVQGL